MSVTPTITDTACCTLNLDRDEKNQKDVISHYCFIVCLQRTASDAENVKSSCKPLHVFRQICSFCQATSNPRVPGISRLPVTPKFLPEHWTLISQESPPAFLCTLAAPSAASHRARLESALFAKLPAVYTSALRFCLTRSSSGSLITTDKLITVSITSLKQCQ